jgi:hypothetical protein
MSRFLWISVVMAGGLACSSVLFAQAPAGESQKPPAASQSSANPFPEDTSSVPVMPSKPASAQPDGSFNGADNAPLPLPGDDLDPVRSPDDPEPIAPSGQPGASSSSLTGLENLLPRPDDDQSGKKRKLAVKEPTHKETVSKDIEVGGYYLETKNWRAALSRFESAVVLDPENPDVYWGLAEANRHLGNLADARANYQKVADYDPDSRHGKEAMKALKEPEIANGKNAASRQPPGVEPAK